MIQKIKNSSLVVRIGIGLTIGAILGLLVPEATAIGIFGDLFVNALKAIAPILVLVLIISALANAGEGLGPQFRNVIALYLTSTMLAAILAVAFSFIFPITLKLTGEAASVEAAPGGLGEIVRNMLINMVQNPVTAITTGNYIGILAWSVALGMAFKQFASDSTKQMISDLSAVVSQVVRWIINLAPFGIMGLVFKAVSESGLAIFTDYSKLLLVLMGCMLTVALILNPLIMFVCLRQNPYPLVFKCLKESGLTAFFTRSSAANIPMNMQLCERLGLDPEMYYISIPLGSTINMDGAAVTITIMTLAAANTVGVPVTVPMAILLSILSTLAACGSSGVAGGSLLLVPMACSLFGIGNDIAMQVVSIGFIISVLQDSVETALNSSGDVMFAATAEYMNWKKSGRKVPMKWD